VFGRWRNRRRVGWKKAPDADHVHMFLSIPPKYAVSQWCGTSREERDLSVPDVCRTEEELRRPAFLGARLLCLDRRSRRDGDSRVHQDAGTRRHAPGSARAVEIGATNVARQWAALAPRNAASGGSHLESPRLCRGLLPKPPADERDYALRSLRTPVESGTQGRTPRCHRSPSRHSRATRGTRIDQAPVRGTSGTEARHAAGGETCTGLLLQPGVARDLPRPDKEVPPMRRFLVLWPWRARFRRRQLRPPKAAGQARRGRRPSARRATSSTSWTRRRRDQDAGNGSTAGDGPRGGTRP